MFEKLKKLARETAIYGISSILSRLLNFLLVPFYTNFFSPNSYGELANLYAYIAFFNVIFSFGMESAYMKYSSLAVTKEEKRKIFSVGFLTIILVSTIASLLIIFYSNAIVGFMSLSKESLLRYAVPIVFLDALAVLPFAELRMQNKALFFALTKSFNIFVNVALNVAFIAFFNYGIEGVLLANLIASACSLLILSKVLLNEFSIRFDKMIFSKMLRFGAPYIPSGLASIALQVIDRPILEKLTTLEEVGVYQANYKLGVFMMLFVLMFQYAYQPFFLQNAKEKSAKDLFAQTLKYFLIASSLILIFLTYFVDVICMANFWGKHVLAPDYWRGMTIIPIILLAYIFNGLYVNFTAGIFIKEKTIYAPIATVSGAISNIALNFVLVPFYGIFGAALATLFSYIVMALVLFYYSQKIYKIDYDFLAIAKIFALMIVFLSFYYLFFSQKNYFILWRATMAILYCFAIFLLKIITFDELANVLKFRR